MSPAKQRAGIILHFTSPLAELSQERTLLSRGAFYKALSVLLSQAAKLGSHTAVSITKTFTIQPNICQPEKKRHARTILRSGSITGISKFQ